MKKTFGKLSYLATCTLLFFAFTSCSDKEDELFDTSSAQSRQENITANNGNEEFVLIEPNLGLFTGTVLVSSIDTERGIRVDVLYDNTTDVGRQLLEASSKASERLNQGSKEKEEENPLMKEYITDDYYMYSHWMEREVKDGRVVVTTYDKETGKYTGISYDADYYKKLFGE